MHRKKDFLHQAIEAGADGFMLKEDADYGLIQAIQAIRRGERYFSPLLMAKLAELAEKKPKSDPLTNRERQIVKLLAEGKTSQEVADLVVYQRLYGAPAPGQYYAEVKAGAAGRPGAVRHRPGYDPAGDLKFGLNRRNRHLGRGKGCFFFASSYLLFRSLTAKEEPD